MSGNLSKDDLFLLLQSYENTVKSNQTLLEQQKRSIENHTKLLDQQAELIKTTNEILKRAEILGIELATHTIAYTTNSEVIERQIGDNIIENIKSHSNLKLKIVIATTGVCGIVISLIALLERMWSKSSTIIILLEGIAKNLGVSP